MVLDVSRVNELFALAQIKDVDLTETNIIVEFIDSDVTADVLRTFGFKG
jgi:hypothetical protein